MPQLPAHIRRIDRKDEAPVNEADIMRVLMEHGERIKAGEVGQAQLQSSLDQIRKDFAAGWSTITGRLDQVAGLVEGVIDAEHGCDAKLEAIRGQFAALVASVGALTTKLSEVSTVQAAQVAERTQAQKALDAVRWAAVNVYRGMAFIFMAAGTIALIRTAISHPELSPMIFHVLKVLLGG